MRSALVAGLLVTLSAVSARADLPGPENTCTVEKQKKAGQTCESCNASHSTPDVCSQQYASTAFTKVCQSSGASVWSEVWCKPDGIDAGSAPAAPDAGTVAAAEVPRPTSNCATGGVTSLAAVIAMALVFRRRGTLRSR